MSPVTRTLSRLLACWLLLTAVGCATLNLTNFDLRSRKATARNPALSVICLWEPAEGRDPNGVPCQGFAGQILFLTNTSLPVSVDGDVRIYLFDDQGTEETQAKPLHQFDFDSGSWEQHYAYGTLGPSYNVFIPYTRRGTYDATCALRVRLKPKAGPTIFSSMTSIKLLGFDDGRHKIKPHPDSRVEQTVSEDQAMVNKRRRTTTIVLNSQNGVASDSAESLPGRTGADMVRQAGYQPEIAVEPVTADDTRAAQLEQMVQELRALQGSKGSATKATAAPSPPPRRLDDEADEEHSRIRLRGSAKATDQSKREAQMDAGRSPRHPLDDTPPRRVISEWTETHPLEESSPVLSAGIPTAGGNRPAKHRHPLDDDQPVEEAAARKSNRTNRVPSQVEQDRSSFDPFDPIDTEAIKTRSANQ